MIGARILSAWGPLMPGIEERSKVEGLLAPALAGSSSKLQNAELLNAPMMSSGGWNGRNGVLGLLETCIFGSGFGSTRIGLDTLGSKDLSC